MAHEFDGERYGQASAHQKEWGRRSSQNWACKGQSVFSIWDVAMARSLPGLQPLSRVGKSQA